MYISTVDIAVFNINRGSVLVGPRPGFGMRRVHDMLRSAPEIRHTFDRLLVVEGLGPALRAQFRRWGLEPELRVSRDPGALARWLTDQTVRGRIGVLPVPDPAHAFAGRSRAQKETIARAAKAKAADTTGNEPLPHEVEPRFVGVMQRVSEHMYGRARIDFDAFARSLGLPTIAGRLLAWVGPGITRGADLSVLAAECRMLSADIIEAMDDLVEAIRATQRALNGADLGRIAPRVANAFEALILHDVFTHLVREREILGTEGRATAGSVDKPNLPKREPRMVALRPAPKPPAKVSPPPKKSPELPPKPKPESKAAHEAKSGQDTAKPATKAGTEAPKKGGFLPKKMGQKEPGAVPMTPELLKEIEDADIAGLGKGLAKEGWPPLRPKELATFLGDALPVELKPGTKLYRIIDEASNPNGAFWSLEPPPVEEAVWRAGAAVLNDWNGDGQYVEHVVGPEGLKGWQGPARAQLSSDKVSALPGGADQFVIPPNSLPPLPKPKPTPWNR